MISISISMQKVHPPRNKNFGAKRKCERRLRLLLSFYQSCCTAGGTGQTGSGVCPATHPPIHLRCEHSSDAVWLWKLFSYNTYNDNFFIVPASAWPLGLVAGGGGGTVSRVLLRGHGGLRRPGGQRGSSGHWPGRWGGFPNYWSGHRDIGLRLDGFGQDVLVRHWFGLGKGYFSPCGSGGGGSSAGGCSVYNIALVEDVRYGWLTDHWKNLWFSGWTCRSSDRRAWSSGFKSRADGGWRTAGLGYVSGNPWGLDVEGRARLRSRLGWFNI